MAARRGSFPVSALSLSGAFVFSTPIAFHQVFQGFQIPLDRGPVVCEFLVGHPFLPDERENTFKAVPVGDDSHGVVEGLASEIWSGL